ncbi:hypothetical protein DYB35_013880, partial [Aphanomyces astaci]
LFRCLSLKLVEAPPPAHDKLVFLNEVWSTITRLDDVHAYLRCAAAFVALLVAHYSTLLGMFQHSTNITLSKRLLNAFVRGNDSGLRLAVDGPHATIVHTLVTMCTRVHDALDCLSSPLDVADASQAICTFVTSLDMHKSDADAVLQMYVECRRLFYKLDAVLACLVRRVLWLSVLVNC